MKSDASFRSHTAAVRGAESIRRAQLQALAPAPSGVLLASSTCVESTLTQSSLESVKRQLLREYLHMPGLSLTVAQAARLLDVDKPICRAVLNDLVNARYLARDASGTFVRQVSSGDLETWKGLVRKRLTSGTASRATGRPGRPLEVRPNTPGLALRRDRRRTR